MSSTPREIGTLIVVILKAKHLPNKRHIGKQDPYCSVYHNGEKRRTKAIKRGGQHPEWDEEVRFTLFEDAELDYSLSGGGTPPPLPPKNERPHRKIKGGATMRLACFADDPREPDLIGEAMVDLTEVLTKGETDEWFTLMHKDKYSGEVYLELTFWSNEPAPQKKRTPRVPISNRQYGGPGSFTPSVDGAPNGHLPASRVASMSILSQHGRQVSDTLAPSMRTSSSLAQLDLYVPPYGRRSPYAEVDQVASDFGELGVAEPARRRESLPVPTYSRALTHAANSLSYTSQAYGYAADDTNSSFIQSPIAQSTLPQPPAARNPRYSIPTSSSGFMPISNTTSYASLPSHPSESSGFAAPPMPQTPQPGSYSGSYTQASGYAPAPSVAPTPSPSTMYSQAPENHLAYSGPMSAPYTPALSAPPPQQFPTYANTPSPSREHVTTYPGSHVTSSGSRPLPQPQGPPQVQPLGPTPTGIPLPHSYSPSHSQPKMPFPSSNGYETSIPPPPPLPSLIQSMNNAPMHTGSAPLALPPPPPLPSSVNNARPRRHSSLPQPPINIPQNRHISLYSSIPPPPPPPGTMVQSKPPLPPTPAYGLTYPHQPSPPRPQLPTPPSQPQYIHQQIAQRSWQ